MNKQNPVAVDPRPLAFRNPGQISQGMVVFDCDYEMPGMVRAVAGLMVELERPTGLIWRAHYRRLRPATPWEKRQLVAVGKLHRTRQRGR